MSLKPEGANLRGRSMGWTRRKIHQVPCVLPCRRASPRNPVSGEFFRPGLMLRGCTSILETQELRKLPIFYTRVLLLDVIWELHLPPNLVSIPSQIASIPRC